MITLGQLQASRLPSRLGLCATDARFLQYVNEAEDRLLSMPHNWWGTYRTVRFCFTGDCRTWIALPPGVVAIRGAWEESCGNGVLLRNEWYQMLAPCIGSVPGDCGCCRVLTDDGQTPVVTEPCAPFRVKVLSHPSDDCRRVRIRGVCDSGPGVITGCQDGEELELNAANPPVTESWFGGISGLSKDETCMPVQFEAWSPDLPGPVIQIGEPEETEIVRRRYRLDGACKGSLMTIVKLGHRTVRNSSDRFVIQNMPALMDAAEAIKAREDRDYERAGLLDQSAMGTLNAELRNYTSDITEVRWSGQPAGSMERVMAWFT